MSVTELMHKSICLLMCSISDITQRGRDIEGVLKQYSTMVKPSYSNYIAPTMAHADIIVPRGGENKVAIQLIVQHVHTQLQLVGHF